MNAIDDLRSYAAIAQAHAEDMQRLVPAFETLYGTLTPAQQKDADVTSAPPSGAATAAAPAETMASRLAGGPRGRERRRLARPVWGSAGPAAASFHEGGHPPGLPPVNIIITDGTNFVTRSRHGKPGDTIRLDIDSKSHPAWTGVQRIIDTGGQVAKFNKKFAGLRHQEVAAARTPPRPAPGRAVL